MAEGYNGLAQVVVIQQCDVCESQENVRWFCVDCEEKLCDNCKSYHLRSKRTKNDRIVTLREARNENRTVSTSVMCDQHPSQVCEFYCLRCNENICSKCLSLFHKNHEWNMLEEVLPIAKSDIEQLKSKLRKTNDDLERYFEHEGKTHSAYIIGLDAMKQDVKTQTKEIIDKVKEAERKQIEKLSELQKQEKDRYQQVCNTFQTQSSSVKSFLVSLEDAELKDVHTMMKIKSQISSSMPNIEVPGLTEAKLPVFKPMSAALNDLTNRLDVSQAGVKTLQTTNTEQNLKRSLKISDIELRKVKTINVASICTKPVIVICPDGNGGAWLVFDDDSFLTHIDQNGNMTKTTTQLKGEIRDAAMNSSGELFIIYENKAHIRKMTPTGKTAASSFVSFATGTTSALVVSDYDIISVGLFDHSTSVSQIKKLTSSGNSGVETQTFNEETNFNIQSMTSLQSDKLAVLYIRHMNPGRNIKLYDSQGQCLFVWGCEIWNKTITSFKPISIAQKGGEVYIADHVNNALYIIKENGASPKCIEGHQLGIHHQPFSIGEDLTGGLWLGCAEGILHIVSK